MRYRIGIVISPLRRNPLPGKRFIPPSTTSPRIEESMIHLLPGLLLSLLPCLQEAVPERVLVNASVEEILEALAEVEGNAPELWWALLERDERSPEVLDALRHGLRKIRYADSRRVIDTILNHWQVPHEAISRSAFLNRSSELVEPDEVCPWKVAPMNGEDAELAELLADPDEKLRLRAAFTLLSRGAHHLDALRAFLPSFPKHDWIRDFAGAAVGEAIGVELAAATSDAERIHLLRVLEKTKDANRAGAMDAVLTFVERNDEIGQRARDVLLDTYIHLGRAQNNRSIHFFTRREKIENPAIQSRLLRIALWLLEDRLEGSPGVPDWDSLDLAALCGIRSAVVREVVVPRLIEILRETGKPRVLRLLCHLGVEDELVRRRYLETLRNWDAAVGGKLELLPYWKDHDEETLAAFDRVFSEADDKLALVHHLVFAGLVDSSEHDIARRFFEAMKERPGEDWGALRAWGFRHVAVPSPEEPKIKQVNKLGLTISTLTARGEDYSEAANALARILQGGYDLGGGGGGSDYYQSAFWHAEALGLHGPEFVEAALRVLESERPLFNHLQFARDLLSVAELTREQAARLAALTWWPAVPRAPRLREIPRLRQKLYSEKWQWLKWLEGLCAVTPLIPRDEEYLLAVVLRGDQWQRRRALYLVRDGRLDSPAIRAAVTDRARDCDCRIRELAGTIVEELGW
jgi:hypothetical protein